MNGIYVIPVGGLCNRMRVIESVFRVFGNTKTRVKIIWFQDKGMSCAFNELFEPINTPNICIEEAKWFDYILFDRARKKNLWLPLLFQYVYFDKRISEFEVRSLLDKGYDFAKLMTLKRAHLASFHSVYEMPDYSIFKPLKPLVDDINSYSSMFSMNTIGVHVRRTDNLASMQFSPLSLFITEMKLLLSQNQKTVFFCASDCVETVITLKKEFGDKIIYQPNVHGRNSKLGIQQGLIDLYLLAKTRKILGSYGSSFSTTAGELSGIKVRILKGN